MAIQPYLRRVLEQRESLPLADARALMQQILAGEAAPEELAALLGALAGRGETAEEIAGFALALREAAHTLPLAHEEQDALVDTCGTGGDASGSFNISTAAALVAAAAGAKVAKHGNRAITSRCGSADVLEALGIPIQHSADEAVAALRAHNFAFLLAPAHHPALKSVMPVRRAIGVRTILHVMGPLLNPAGARRQVMGVYDPRLVPLVGRAFLHLGARHVMVISGDHGQDEIALSGPTLVAEVKDGQIREYSITPEDFGLTRAPLASLQGGDAQANARILTNIFAGEPGPPRDIVLLNAAAVLVTAGMASDIRHGLTLAGNAVDSGRVTDLVSRLKG